MNLLHSIKAFESDTVINVIIEIPCGSKEKIEYSVDQEKFIVDRVLTSNLSFPFNYGFIPESWSSDNDPFDVAVISSEVFPTGSQVKVRIIGLLETTDQSGKDSKLITIPITETNPLFASIEDVSNLDKDTLANIEYFYKNYKINEPNKWVDINGYLSKQEAEIKIKEAVEHYHQHFQK